MGVIGFCMGGGYALALAPGGEYAVASVNCGGCPNDAEHALAETCPIVGSYGKKDGSPIGWRAAERLEQALTTLVSTTTSRSTPTQAMASSTTTIPTT